MPAAGCTPVKGYASRPARPFDLSRYFTPVERDWCAGRPLTAEPGAGAGDRAVSAKAPPQMLRGPDTRTTRRWSSGNPDRVAGRRSGAGGGALAAAGARAGPGRGRGRGGARAAAGARAGPGAERGRRAGRGRAGGGGDTVCTAVRGPPRGTVGGPTNSAGGRRPEPRTAASERASGATPLDVSSSGAEN